MITYKLKINFQDPRVLNSDMEFVTGDIGAYRLEFEFYDNGKRADLTGKLLTVRARRADGVCFSANGEITDGIGVFVPKNSLYSVPGEVYFEIALSDAAQNYATVKILTAAVIDGIGDVPEATQEDVSVYVTLLAQTKTLIDEANKLIEDTQISIDEQLSELGEAVEKKANGADVYTKSEADSYLAKKADADDVYDKAYIDGHYYTNAAVDLLLSGAAENAFTWGGNLYGVDELEELGGPQKKIFYHAAADIISAVRYTGKLSDFFVTSYFPDESKIPQISSVASGFDVPEKCKRTNGTYYYVRVYDSNGRDVGELCGNPDFLPPHYSIAELGATAESDTVTFYLGVYSNSKWPDKCYTFRKGDMIFSSDGLAWQGLASSAVIDMVENVAELQNELAEALNTKADSENCFRYLGAVTDIESVTDGKNGDTCGVKCLVSPDGYYYSGIVGDLFGCGTLSYDFSLRCLKFTPPEDTVWSDGSIDDFNPNGADMVMIYNTSGKKVGCVEAQSPAGYPHGQIDAATEFGVTSETDTISFFIAKTNGATSYSSMPETITVNEEVTALYTRIDGNWMKLG